MARKQRSTGSETAIIAPIIKRIGGGRPISGWKTVGEWLKEHVNWEEVPEKYRTFF